MASAGLEAEVARFLARCVADDRAAAPADSAAATTDRCCREARADPASDSGRAFRRFLRGMPLCADLSSEAVAALVGSCCIETIAACQEVCREGDCDQRLFVILSGSLVVQQKSSPALSSSSANPASTNPFGPGPGRAVELRAGEALGILSALAGRPKTSDVRTGHSGCELGVVSASVLAPYLLDHVAAVVSRIQATPIEPSKYKEPSPSTLSAPILPPSIEKSPANSDREESIGRDNEEGGASSGKDDEDLKDEFYSMLGLLPPNRLSKFIDQMRRNALTLCASMLGAWSAHSWEHRRMLEVCGRCLKRTFARAFVRWQQATADSKAEIMADRMQMLVQELREARDKLKEREEQGHRQEERLRLLQQHLDIERGKSVRDKDKRTGGSSHEAQERWKTGAGIEQLEMMMHEVQRVIETVEGALVVISKLARSSAGAYGATATRIRSGEIGVDQDGARTSQERRGVGVPKTVMECEQTEYDVVPRGGQPGDIEKGVRGNDRPRATNPFASPESTLNASFSPALTEKQTESGESGQAEVLDEHNAASRGADGGEYDEFDRISSSQEEDERSNFNRSAADEEHVVTAPIQRKNINEHDIDIKHLAGALGAVQNGRGCRGESNALCSDVRGINQKDRELSQKWMGRRSMMEASSPLLQPFECAHGADFPARLCEDGIHEQGENGVGSSRSDDAQYGSAGDECETISALKGSIDSNKHVRENFGLRCGRGGLPRDHLVDTSGVSPSLSPVLRNSSDRSTPSFKSAGTSNPVSPALQGGDVRGPKKCVKASQREQGSWQEGKMCAAESIRDIDCFQNAERWERKWGNDETSTEILVSLEELSAFRDQQICDQDLLFDNLCKQTLGRQRNDSQGQRSGLNVKIEIPCPPTFAEDRHDPAMRPSGQTCQETAHSRDALHGPAGMAATATQRRMKEDSEEMRTQSEVESKKFRENGSLNRFENDVETGFGGGCENEDEVEGDAIGENNAMGHKHADMGAKQVRQGGRQGVDFNVFYQKRAPVDAHAKSEVMWSDVGVPLTPASPYSVPATPLTLGPMREVGMSPLARARGDVPFFHEDHFPCDTAAEVVGGGYRQGSRPIEHVETETGRPAAAKESSPSRKRTGGQEVVNMLQSEEVQTSREGESRKGVARSKSGVGMRRKPCEGKHRSGAGHGGTLRQELNLREAPSTRASRLKQNASAPARKRSEKEQYLHSVAEEIAKKMLAKGVQPSSISAGIIAREASKCRLSR